MSRPVWEVGARIHVHVGPVCTCVYAQYVWMSLCASVWFFGVETSTCVQVCGGSVGQEGEDWGRGGTGSGEWRDPVRVGNSKASFSRSSVPPLSTVTWVEEWG